MRFFTISFFISLCLMAVCGLSQTFTGTPQTIVSQYSATVTDVGESNSLRIINGRPAISYHAKGAGVFYIRSDDASGSAWPAAGTRAANITYSNSIIVSNLSVAAGNPLLLFSTLPGNAALLRKADDANGAGWTAPALTISSSVKPYQMSLAVVDGFPAFSYYDPFNYDLVYIRATNADGSAWGAPVILDNGASGDARGTYNSLVVVDGRPAVAYYNTKLGELMYVRANDATGTSWPAPQVVDTDGNNGRCASMNIVDGYPAIAYQNWTNNNLRYVRANDAAGSSWGTPQTLDSGDDTGYSASLAVVNGVPAISYLTRKSNSVELRFVRGSDAEGSSAWTTPQTLDVMNVTVALSGFDYSRTSLAEVNGTPAISYYDMAGKDLKYIRSATPVFVQSGPPILYVKIGGTGNGTSWIDAMGDIQDAINSPGAEQVWVAKGTYYPAGDGLTMKNSVAIYGGFPDDDDDAGMNERDWTANPTILHGNNERIVVSNIFTGSEPLTSSAILDGFTIIGGNSTYAGGMANYYASPVLRNLVITGNQSTGEGGGMYNGECAPTLTNVTISANSTTTNGGGMYNENASPVLTGVTITGNSAVNGGGIYNRGTSLSLTGTTISHNTAQFGGGVYNDLSSSAVLTNALIHHNTATTDGDGGGGIYNGDQSSLTLINATVTENNSELLGGGIANFGASLLVYNSIIWGNVYNDYVGALDPASSHNNIGATDPLFVNAGASDYRLKLNSPAINAGSNSAYGDLSVAKDLDGNPRLWGAAIDMGAYENQDASLPVKLVSFKAAQQENTVLLSWQTTGEVNASHFEIERSADSKSFGGIGSVAAKGSGKYTFADPFDYAQGPPSDYAQGPLSDYAQGPPSDYAQGSPLSTAAAAALNYYRLKIVDMDGSYAYSAIRMVSFKKSESTASGDKLYPNPSAKGTVILETASGLTSPVIRIFDGLGREVPARITGRNGKYFIETAGLPSGMYHVQVRKGKDRQIIQLVITD